MISMRREPVPTDLSKVKTKLAFNLTKRQLVCFGAAGLTGVPMYFVLRLVVGDSVATFLTMFLVMPFFLFAMYEKNGQPLEVYLGYVWRYLRRPKRRPYEVENIYTLLERQEKLNKEVQAIVCSNEAHRTYAFGQKGSNNKREKRTIHAASVRSAKGGSLDSKGKVKG